MKLINLGEAWGQPAVASFIRGSKAQLADNMDEADLFVCWGLRPPHEQMVQRLNQEDRCVVVIDSGYLKRPSYLGIPGRRNYYSVSLGGILNPIPTAAVSRGIFTSDQLDDRRACHSEYLAPAVQHGSMNVDGFKTVILGQVLGDRSHNISSQDEMLTVYKGMVDSWKTLFRPHPQHNNALTDDIYDVVEVLDPTEPLIAQLERLGGVNMVLVRTINSNAGLEAKLAGYRVETSGCAWYSQMSALDAFNTACDAQFNCMELEVFGNKLAQGLAEMRVFQWLEKQTNTTNQGKPQ